jgi:ferrochelatase
MADIDALLLVSFGGPEGPDDVIPFLERVLAGRNVPRSRLEAVAEHYLRFGGVSPINGQNRALEAAIEADLAAHGPALPVYWGNRNWHPLLADTLRRMRADGVRRAAAFVTSAYASVSGCHQYRDDLARARASLGAGAPDIVKLRLFFDHPGFVEPFVEAVTAARADAGPRAPVLFTAHSIPVSMASGAAYAEQLEEVAALVAARSGPPPPEWEVVYQSRSGRPGQPWLEPDVVDVVRGLAGTHEAVVVAPIGFVSDHMEVVYDLDTEAAAAAADAGIRLVRAATPGTHPAFVAMVRALVGELDGGPCERLTPAPLGGCGADGCCGGRSAPVA